MKGMGKRIVVLLTGSLGGLSELIDITCLEWYMAQLNGTVIAFIITCYYSDLIQVSKV